MIERTTYRIPSIAETASLIKTNYCAGCPKFRVGGEYGECFRMYQGEVGWRVIPERAIVADCVCEE